MALRFWSRRANGLSNMVSSFHHILCNNLSTLKASTVASSASEDGHTGAALKEVRSTLEMKKKERLSRQERTALVESFVIKHMEAHGGAFPSVSAVLKETGGGRSAVKDIFYDVESRFRQLSSRETSLGTLGAGRSSDDRTKEESCDVGSSAAQVFGQHALNGTSSGNSSEDSEDSDEVFYTEDVINEEMIEELGGIPEAERKSVTFTNGQMIGSTHGEIETHSALWSRLRKLGSQSLVSNQQPSSQESHVVALNGSSDDSTKEYGITGRSVALNFSDLAYLDIKSTLQNQQLEQRHGLFVRYLSPQATPNDLKEAFSDCGEIVRAQAIKPRTHQKYTYGFVDFKTAEALQKALEKDKVYIRGVRIRKEPSSSSPKTSEKKGIPSSDMSSTRNTDGSSGSFLGLSRAKNIRSAGYTVAVESVPLHISLNEVKKALSKYGDITSSSRKQVGHGGYIANVEFKRVDACERALSRKPVHLSGMHYTIMGVDPVKTSVVRLSYVGAGVGAEQIQAACELIGRVEKVVTRCDGIVDVYFHSTELENMPLIMSRLNEVKVGGQLLQAQPSSSVNPSSFLSLMRTTDGEEWLQQESDRMLRRVESALKHLVVDVEDLQNVVKMRKEYTPS